MKLPPRDPYESSAQGPPPNASLPAPTAIFMCGPPSPEADRLSDMILDFRPGALFVASHD
jgi:hypothetical protein